MSYLFSANENAFFPISLQQQYIDAGTWPDDGIEVNDAVFEIYSNSPPSGKIRGVIDGMPAWIDLPELTQQQLIEQAEQKRVALRTSADAEIIWRQDALDVGIATENEAKELTEWKKYRVLLMRVDTSTAPNIEWPANPA